MSLDQFILIFLTIEEKSKPFIAVNWSYEKLHDNVQQRQHTVQLINDTSFGLGWEVLPHSTNTTELAPSYHHHSKSY